MVGNESGTVRSGDNSAHKVVQREALDFNWTEVIGGLARDATALLASGSLTGPPRLIFCVAMLGWAWEPASGGKPTQHPAVPTSSREKGCRESVEVRSERSAWLVSVTGVATSPTFLFKFSETRAFKIPEYIKEGRRFAQITDPPVDQQRP